MTKKNVTRADLATAIYQEVGLPHSECTRLIEDVLDKIADALAEGREVKISGFGSFEVRHKAERIGRNPRTGEDAIVSARRVLMFKASQNLKLNVAVGSS